MASMASEEDKDRRRIRPAALTLAPESSNAARALPIARGLGARFCLRTETGPLPSSRAWSGSISFGLTNAPVGPYSVTFPRGLEAVQRASSKSDLDAAGVKATRGCGIGFGQLDRFACERVDGARCGVGRQVLLYQGLEYDADDDEFSEGELSHLDSRL